MPTIRWDRFGFGDAENAYTNVASSNVSQAEVERLRESFSPGEELREEGEAREYARDGQTRTYEYILNGRVVGYLLRRDDDDPAVAPDWSWSLVVSNEWEDVGRYRTVVSHLLEAWRAVCLQRAEDAVASAVYVYNGSSTTEWTVQEPNDQTILGLIRHIPGGWQWRTTGNWSGAYNTSASATRDLLYNVFTGEERGSEVPRATATTRRCRDCDERLPLTEEYFYSTRRDGPLGTRCRNCRRRRDRERRANRRGEADAEPTGDGRIFGVEMELTGPGALQIIQALTGAGITMNSRNRAMGAEIQYTVTNTNRHEWTLKHDGSVRGNGLELVSPKLRGEAGFNELRRVCDVLKEVGATVDQSCGLHVHHDFRGLGLEVVRRQVLAFLERQCIIAEMIQPSRRSGNGYCETWGASSVEYARTRSSLQLLATCGPRGNLNLWAYSTHGSVELRWHGGTTRYEKVAAWVRFGQAIFAAGEDGAEVSSTDAEQLLIDLAPFGLTPTDAAWLLRFRTAGTTRAEVADRLRGLVQQGEVAESVLEEV